MPVTIDDVAWCYRNLLGREPESTLAAQAHASAVDDVRSLFLRFITSQEFLTKKHEASALVQLDAPAMRIELEATPSQMAQFRQRIREAWTQLGKERPHHSVLTEAHYLPENVDANRFWASGLAEAESIRTVLRRHGFTDVGEKTCVEYGCGMGRVTCGFAKAFARVHGYDISPSHLELSKQHAAEIGIENITFHLCCEDVLLAPLEECDFFYSRIVFQHNPPPLIRELIAASFRSLRPGGIAIFQVPTYGSDYNFFIKDYLTRSATPDMEMHCIPQPEVFLLAAAAGCQVLEVREDGAVGWRGRWISDTFIVQRPEVDKATTNVPYHRD